MLFPSEDGQLEAGRETTACEEKRSILHEAEGVGNSVARSLLQRLPVRVLHLTPNVRGNAGPTDWRQAREAEDVPHGVAGLVPSRWASR